MIEIDESVVVLPAAAIESCGPSRLQARELSPFGGDEKLLVADRLEGTRP